MGHRGVNCWEGHGGRDLELVTGNPFAQISFAECKAMCNLTPDCQAITFRPLIAAIKELSASFGDCYRRGSINISSCYHGAAFSDPEYDTWVKSTEPALPRSHDACESLSVDQCAHNAHCRACGTQAYSPSICVPQSLADQYFPISSCLEPVAEYNPCKSISVESCRSWEMPECRECIFKNQFTAPYFTCNIEVVAEYGSIGLWYCTDDAYHHDVYKAACSQLDSQHCQEAPLCSLCELPSTTTTICIDKDDFPSICSTTSSTRMLHTPLSTLVV